MTRGTRLSLTRDEVVQRALAQMLVIPTPPAGAPPDAGNRPIAYRLEKFNGDHDPTAPHCADWSYGLRTPTADCIGFALYSIGCDRLQPGYQGSRGEWLNCASICDDADGAQVYFKPAGGPETVKPGDLLLTPDHISVVLRPDVHGNHLVIDCSPRHGRDHAIMPGFAWSEQCRVVVYKMPSQSDW